jgi:ribonuclease Z
VKAIRFPRTVGEAFPSELELRVGSLTVRGTSVAARATAFSVPSFGVALDVGRMTPAIAQQPVVLLSHGHLDHLSGILAYFNVRARFHRRKPPRLYAPEGVAAGLRQALAVMPGMESVRRLLRLEDVIVGVSAGDRVPVPGGWAQAFAVDHGVPTLGWVLRRPRRRRPEVVFASDGSTQPFAADPGLLDARVALVECTFVQNNRRVAARMAAHAHLKDWIEIAPRLGCDRLVLTHLPPMEVGELAVLAEPLAKALPGELVLWVTPA